MDTYVSIIAADFDTSAFRHPVYALDVERVHVQLNEEDEWPRHTCGNCDATSAEEDRHGPSVDEGYDRTCAASEDGRHAWRCVPIGWCKSASVSVDQGSDEVTMTISIDGSHDPLTMKVRRVPDDADSELAGRLIVHAPYNDMPSPHVRRLRALGKGSLLVT